MDSIITIKPKEIKEIIKAHLVKKKYKVKKVDFDVDVKHGGDQREPWEYGVLKGCECKVEIK